MSRNTVLFDINETVLDLSTLRPGFENAFGDQTVAATWFATLLHSSTVCALTGVKTRFAHLARIVLEALAARRGIEISSENRDAILSGSKEAGTDIHNLNRRALLLDHITRDMSKRFIYSFLLGAGLGQISSILKCNMNEARQAVDNFYMSIDGLHQLKFETIPKMWQRGYFTGLDGRRIKPPSQHHMLAGMLQAGEAVVMKTAFLRWRETCKDIPHKLLTWPHDEWQVECFSKEDAIELGKRQCDAIEWAGQQLNLFCPMSGETRIGYNWAETH